MSRFPSKALAVSFRGELARPTDDGYRYARDASIRIDLGGDRGVIFISRAAWKSLTSAHVVGSDVVTTAAVDRQLGPANHVRSNGAPEQRTRAVRPPRPDDPAWGVDFHIRAREHIRNGERIIYATYNGQASGRVVARGGDVRAAIEAVARDLGFERGSSDVTKLLRG